MCVYVCRCVFHHSVNQYAESSSSQSAHSWPGWGHMEGFSGKAGAGRDSWQHWFLIVTGALSIAARAKCLIKHHLYRSGADFRAIRTNKSRRYWVQLAVSLRTTRNTIQQQELLTTNREQMPSSIACNSNSNQVNHDAFNSTLWLNPQNYSEHLLKHGVEMRFLTLTA